MENTLLTLCIFRSNARGMYYGMGSYIRNLIGGLLKNYGISIILVNYYSSSYKEFNVIKNGARLTEIFIPAPRIGIGHESQKQRYAHRIIDLLDTEISYSGNIIFLVNYLDTIPIIKKIRSRYQFPIVSVIHSAQWQLIYEGNKQKFIERWPNKFNPLEGELKPLIDEKELYELSDKIISVTDYMKEYIIKYYNISEEKILVVRNGIDNTIFQKLSKEEKEFAKQKLGFNREEKIVLYSGRLDTSKGIRFLLDCFSEVVKELDNIRLVLIGEDSGPEKISQYLTRCTNIWGKVTFTGFIEYEHILKFYQIADVGIIPSIYDHCPYVALEMIGHGLPIIISNTEGLNEILTDNQSIYLTPRFDKEGNLSFDKNEIADAILSIVNDEEKAKLITRDYPELIMTRFSSERMASEFYSILKTISTV